MKKLFSIMTILALFFSLTACAKHDCDGCGKKNGGVHHIAEGSAEEGWLCDDCNRLNNLLSN